MGVVYEFRECNLMSNVVGAAAYLRKFLAYPQHATRDH